MHTSSIWTFGPFEFNPSTYRLRRDGVDVPLEPKAFDVLRLLVERAPAVVDKGVLFDVVWHDVAVTDNALTRVVAQLRKALDDDARQPRYIETVATRGYRLMAEVHAGAALFVPTPASAPTPTNVAPVLAATSLGSHSARARVPRAWLIALGAVLVLATTAIALATSLKRVVMRSPAASVVRVERGPSVAQVARARPVQFTTGPGLDGQPALSTDGTTLAFSSDRSGALEIYTQSLTPGAAPTQLTDNGRTNIQPTWSPDGRFIAYHEAAGGGIWMVPSRGGTAKLLASAGSRPAWSPDGRLVAYQSLVDNLIPSGSPPNAGSEIRVVDVATGVSRALTHAGTPVGPHVVPHWWPAGGRLFFIEAPPPFRSDDGGGRTTLWSVDVSSGAMRREAASTMVLPDYALAPDGSGAWVLARTGAVWWLPLTGDLRSREPRPSGLTAPGFPGDLTLSSDGRSLAWTARAPTTSLWSVGLPSTRGRAAPAEPVQLGAGVRVTGAVAAPDGRLAYSGIVHGASPQVWIREKDGDVRQVTLDRGDHANPTWLPGYTQVAFAATHDAARTVNVVDVTTGVERTLFRCDALPLPPGTTLHPAPYLNVAVDHSGRRVLATLLRDGVPNVWVSDLGVDGTPSAPRQVTVEAQGGSFAHWSPDGRWISYQCDEGAHTHVCVIGADGTGRRQLTNQPGQSFLGGWIESTTILVAARRDAVWNVIGVDRATGKTTAYTTFTDARGYVRYPQWDPVTRRVTFERADTTGNVWMTRVPTGPGVRVSGF